MAFNPNLITGAGAADAPRKRVRSEKLFMAVHAYETPAEGFHYAVGHLVDDPSETVRVRLNTVQERSADRPNQDPESIRAQYATGENRRKSLSDMQRQGVPLLSFDDARLVSEEDGVREYRAHWPKTMATQKDAEVLLGVANVRLRPAVEVAGSKRVPARTYVDLLQDGVTGTPENVDSVLRSGLSITDNLNRPRSPFVILRASFNGQVVRTTRIYAATEKTRVFDQTTGETREVPRRVDATRTLQELLEGKPGADALANLSLDRARAMVAGLKDVEPKFSSTDMKVLKDSLNLYHGVKEGAIQVEIIPAEQIRFGIKSAQSYLVARDRPHLAVYNKIEENDGRSNEVPAFTPTVVAIQRFPDGQPYVVFAAPTEMFPTGLTIDQLPLRREAPVAESEASMDRSEEATPQAASKASPTLAEREGPVGTSLSLDDDHYSVEDDLDILF